MVAIQLGTVLLIAVFVNSCFAATVKIMYEKCGSKGFSCENSKQIANKVDLVFTCNNVTGQDVTVYLWQFNAPGTINSLTVQKCETLRLTFACSAENKPIQWLKVSHVKNLEIIPGAFTHNPPKVIFDNVGHLETLPRHTFSQIKHQAFKPGCFVPTNDLEEIEFTNVNIGTIETEAFKTLTNMKNFTWINVSVVRTAVNAIQLNFLNGGCGKLKNCKLEVIEPMGFRLIGEEFSITQGRIGDIWGSGINGTIYEFEFSNNSVGNIQSGAIAILAQNVNMEDNHFKHIESGAFQKIGPGLLHDSKRNFGKLIFHYKFSNNLLQSVEDGGIKPDIIAYKNVAAEVIYTYNTLQCSCEGLTWLGADVDLGFGYSVLKDFNTMIMDPKNSNMCTFTPCMCFGVRAQNKKNTSTAAIF